MKRGGEDAADEPEATIGAEQSAAVAAAAVGAAESAVVASAGGAATAVPAPAAIAAVEVPVGEHVQEKAAEDLEQEKERLEREVHDQIEELFEENAIKEFDEDFRKGSEFDEDAIDELSEEDDVDVDYGMDSRHSKSRYTLKHLIAGKIKYRFYGKIGCPFCSKVIDGGFDGMIQHAIDTGDGSVRKHKASSMAKHGAYGIFLKKYVRGNEPFYIPPVKKAKK